MQRFGAQTIMLERFEIQLCFTQICSAQFELTTLIFPFLISNCIPFSKLIILSEFREIFFTTFPLILQIAKFGDEFFC